MKTMKKFASLLLALAMIFSLATTAFAADKNDSITVNNAKVGETYNLYNLFDLKVDLTAGENAGYAYTVNTAWAAFFADGGEGAKYVTIENGYVTGIKDNEAGAAALAKAAAEWTGKPDATQIKKANAESVTFEGLADGYWLITSTLGTIAMTETTPDKSAVTINEKNPEDTIIKEVKEDNGGTWGEENDAQVGDTVEFKSTVKIVKGTRNVVVHDKMDSGLTYTAGSVAIEGLTKGTEYTVNENPGHDDTFDITFTQSWIDSLDFGTAGYKEYVITYTATLNENAVVKGDNGVAIVDQYNRTHVSYGDDTDSEQDSTKTTTHKFSVHKHAAGKTENLAGAVFSLKKGTGDTAVVVNLIWIDDNNYRVAKNGETGVATFTTVANGDIVIWGVDDDANDVYTLEETKAPDGYNKLTKEVNVTVNADNSTRIDVENNSGAELPDTGGMGTTLFYVLGGIMVAAAAVLLVTKKRMAN